MTCTALVPNRRNAGDRVWVPPGYSSVGLNPRTGTIEHLDHAHGGVVVRHDNGLLLGWMHHEIAPISTAPLMMRITGRISRWWQMFRRRHRRRVTP